MSDEFELHDLRVEGVTEEGAPIYRGARPGDHFELRGNNGLSGLQNVPGLEGVPQASVALGFLWASALALAGGYVLALRVVSGRFGSVIRGIRDDEARVRHLGYDVERYKLAVFTLTAVIAAVAGVLYYPQAGIVNPAELAPIASIYLAVWVAIGGRGRLYGAVVGAASVSLLSSWFTGGGVPDLALGGWTLAWTDWWLVALGLGFVLVTLHAPEGLGGLLERLARRLVARRPAPTPEPERQADLGPDAAARRPREAAE